MTADPVISLTELQRAATALRAMAYEHRLHILVLLRAGDATPSIMAESISAHSTAVAHHLRHLVDAGLIRRRRHGRQVIYSLRGEMVGRLIDEVVRYVRE
jgi:DNA-binding transcriptional ArsR family regulator